MEPRDAPFSPIHEASLQKQGLALSFPWEPFPSNRGPSPSMGHAMGATALEGMDALLNPTTMEGLEPTPVVGSSLRQR